MLYSLVFLSFNIILLLCDVSINSPCHYSHMRVQNDISVQRNLSSNRQKRGATFLKNLLWPNGIIPYSISDRFPQAVYKNIKKSIKIWETNTCLKFRPLTNETHGLKFEPQDCGCCSFVGRQSFGNNKPQEISINGQDCEDVGHMLHEIGHAIGFWHEHVRPDRDKYVRLKENNIDFLSVHNFERKNATEINSLGEKYDYNSIMHYSSRSFSVDVNRRTILPTKRYKMIGQRIQLSIGDIRQANKLYNCKSDQNQCQMNNGGCQHQCINLHNGHKCKCRKGFTLGKDGKTCDLLCSQWYDQPEGLIFSSNYPRHYLPDSSCIWELRAPVGFIIKLHFLKFRLEHSSTCSFDVLSIRRLVNYKWEDVAILCGSEINRKIIIRSNIARLLFRSDDSIQTNGFKIYYQYEPSICSLKPRNCHLIPPIDQLYFIPTRVGESCDKEYNLSSGDIQLPNNRPISCTMKISIKGRKNIALVVKNLTTFSSVNCEDESVVVKLAKSLETIASLCGSMQAHIIHTGAKSVIIEVLLSSFLSELHIEYFSM